MLRDRLGPWPPAHVLYPFRFRNPVTGKWARARYVAELEVIVARHKEWEITGPPEVRPRSSGRYFTPHPVELLAPRPRPLGQRYLELGPHRRKRPGIDARERQLVGVFLRRLIVYEARRGRFERVRNAADLLADLTSNAHLDK